MEALLLFAVLVGLVLAGLGVAFYARLWSTLGMHRQAMHALHQELSYARLLRHTTSSVPPQEPGR